MIKLKNILKEWSEVDTGPKRWFKPFGDKYTAYERFTNKSLKELTPSKGFTTKIKEIDIWFEDRRGRFYKVLIDGERHDDWDGWSDSEEQLSNLLGWDISLRTMDDRTLEKAAKDLKRKGIKLTWDDVMDVS